MPEDRQIGYMTNSTKKPKQQGTNWLLVIGIDQYEHHNNLHKAVADAEGFAKVMTTRYGFEHLQPPLYNKDATQRNIRRALGQCKTLGEQDSLIVFYAGHGWYDAKTQLGHIVPTEAEGDPASDFIPTNFITNIFQGVDAKHILLIVDCCFGGSFGVERNSTDAQSTQKVNSQLDSKRSRLVLSSGGIEPVSDGLVAANNSPFTSPLLDILTTNQSPLMVISEVFPLLRKKANWETAQQMAQYKVLQGLKHGDGELGFYCKDLGSEEEKAYNEAKIVDDIGIYEKFIKDFPKSELKAEIRELLKLKRAFVEWTKIKDTDYIERLDGFIHKFEYSPYAQLAQQRIDELDNIKLEKEQAILKFNVEQEEKHRTKEALKIEQQPRTKKCKLNYKRELSIL
jgi:Caspase domain